MILSYHTNIIQLNIKENFEMRVFIFKECYNLDFSGTLFTITLLKYLNIFILLII